MTAHFPTQTSIKSFKEETIQSKTPSALSTKSVGNFSEYRSLKAGDVDRMPLDELKRFAMAMQKEITKCKTSDPLNPAGVREEKLKGLLVEREQWQSKAKLEEKKLYDATLQLEVLKNGQ